jgi:pimeloyl-ACP methyl ester carboxylesterase
MPYAPVRDLQMYYEFHGPEEAEPLLLLDGAFGVIASDSDWGKVLPRLAEEYRVIAFEHRGHGRTNNPANKFTGYDQLADDAIALLDYLGYKKVHMVGFSDGAITLLDLSTRYQQYVDTLVLVGANYYNDQKCMDAMTKLTASYIEQNYPDWTATLEKHHGYQGEGYWKKLANQMYEMWMDNKPNFTTEEMSQIKLPTLVMSGQYDNFGNREQTLAIHDSIAGSELCIVPGAAHPVMTQRPEISALIILDYLRRQRKKRDRNK